MSTSSSDSEYYNLEKLELFILLISINIILTWEQETNDDVKYYRKQVAIFHFYFVYGFSQKQKRIDNLNERESLLEMQR